MKISHLLNDEVEETIVVGKKKLEVKVWLMPNIYTAEDSANVDRDNQESVIRYLLKGLKKWDLETDDGEMYPLTVEDMIGRVPEMLLLAIYDRLESLKQSSVGKLKMFS